MQTEDQQQDPTTAPEATVVGAENSTSTEGKESGDSIAKFFQNRVSSTKRLRRDYITEMKRNIDARLGRKPTQYTDGVTDNDPGQAELNPDWSLTKTKTANLYSQVPRVNITHELKDYAQVVPFFTKALNYEIGPKRANVGVAMEEVLNDTVNAAGFGYVRVGYAARFQPKLMALEKQIPGPDGQPVPTDSMDDATLQQLEANGVLHTQQVPQVVDYLFFIRRGSPASLLWPVEFVGSDFDDADFVGESGTKSWAEAKNEFKLTEDQKDAVTGEKDKAAESLRDDAQREVLDDLATVRYDEIFYWRYRVDPDEKCFKCIWRLVFVHGINKPVVHEPWKGQEKVADGKYVGACRFPIRVLTLTYITDNPIPPSDTAAGRAQVRDMRTSRSQMFENRRRSIPIRWFDVNRVDPLIQDSLMKGTWQGFIPTNGDGARSIGEIARASYPSEDLAFDQTAKSDLQEMWQIGPNQSGTMVGGRPTKAQVDTVQSNFATRIGQERAHVTSFFLGICDVLTGLMVLYSDFPMLSQQEKQTLETTWDMKSVQQELVLNILPDSSIVLDTEQQIQRLLRFLNMTVKSGFVNPQPIIFKLAELSGLDPAEVMVTPQPKGPEPPNISFRFASKDDLINPLVMALLVKSGQAPDQQALQAAIQLLQAAQTGGGQPPQPPAGAGAPTGPAGPGAPLPPGAPAAPAGGASPPPPGGMAHPDWSLGDRIAKRSRDANA